MQFFRIIQAHVTVWADAVLFASEFPLSVVGHFCPLFLFPFLPVSDQAWIIGRSRMPDRAMSLDRYLIEFYEGSECSAEPPPVLTAGFAFPKIGFCDPFPAFLGMGVPTPSDYFIK